MKLEQYIGHVAFDVLWNLVCPQLPGVTTVVGFMLGLAFILGLVNKVLAQFGINAAATGDIGKKPRPKW